MATDASDCWCRYSGGQLRQSQGRETGQYIEKQSFSDSISVAVGQCLIAISNSETRGSPPNHVVATSYNDSECVLKQTC